MKREYLVGGVVGMILGCLIVGLAMWQINKSAYEESMKKPASLVAREGVDKQEMSMSEMTNQLQSLEGVNFDKAFLEFMIEHHQNAIDMAQLAKVKAISPDLVLLADNIISAQEKEIQDMRKWQVDWGYSKEVNMTTTKWEDAKAYFGKCEVKMTIETHSGELQLNLSDGSTKRIKPYNSEELQFLTQEANIFCPEQIVIAME